jgi:hypothetical protein
LLGKITKGKLEITEKSIAKFETCIKVTLEYNGAERILTLHNYAGSNENVAYPNKPTKQNISTKIALPEETTFDISLGFYFSSSE